VGVEAEPQVGAAGRLDFGRERAGTQIDHPDRFHATTPRTSRCGQPSTVMVPRIAGWNLQKYS
jgi:hypothetical protein